MLSPLSRCAVWLTGSSTARRPGCCVAVCLVTLFASAAWCAESPHSRGAAIFQERCAACHGEAGAGTPEYPQQLVGDLSVRELAQLIEATMPEGEPEQCAGDDALRVAEYLHDAFYSILAQERNRPAAIEFCRLTARQHANSVSDLIASFRRAPALSAEPGLKASYYKGKNPGGKGLVLERIDPVVDFQFGDLLPEGYPAPEPPPEEPSDKKEQRDPRAELEYSVRWTGSIFAPATGTYEFIVVTQNGARLWLNQERSALIDGWVKSSNQTEYRGTARLLGGRWYPLRLEMARYREPDGGIALKWKPPRLAEELVPQRALRAEQGGEVFVPSTPFPADDRSLGYERGSSLSQEWQEAAARAALETAHYVVDAVGELSRSRRSDGDREVKLKRFCERFVERAFRRPLTEAERERFIEKQFGHGAAVEAAVQRCVLLALMSPRFLYRETALGPLDEFAVASWLSYSLWDSLPDEALFSAAREGRLSAPESALAEIDRLLADPRALARQREFLRTWLQLDRDDDLVKDASLFPEFDDQIVADLETSLDRFLESVLTSSGVDFRELLTSDEVWMNGRLGKFYGLDLEESAEFRAVTLSGQSRAGVLTHPLLLATLAYPSTSSPIHRGVFVSRSLLGRRLKPPPEAFAPLAPDLHADLNTRERVQLQTSPAACQGCHGMINPLGFSLEHFDAVGRYREQEQNREIDARGGYIDRSGVSVEFAGAAGLAAYLAGSPEVQSAFVEQLFQFLFKQPLRAFGEAQQAEFQQAFAAREFNIRELIREMARASAEGIPRAAGQTTRTAAQ